MAAHKRLILLIMIVMFAVVPCFANMPVIDITAITQAIASYYQTISQWQSQLQQWKSEFDRIEKAAQGIASGDYMQVLSSIASLSGQISSWNISKTAFNSTLIDDAFGATSDSTYSLLNIISNSKLLVSNFDSIMKLMESKSDKFDSTLDTAQDKVAVTSSYTLDTYSDMLSMIKTLLLNGGNIGTEVANMYNNLADIFNVTPAEYATLLEDMKEQQLSSIGLSDPTTKGIENKLSAKSEELANAESEKLKTKQSEEPTKYAELEQKISKLKEEVELYTEVYEWSTEMDKAISNVKSNQSAYEAAQNFQTRKALKEDTAIKSREYADLQETTADKLTRYWYEDKIANAQTPEEKTNYTDLYNSYLEGKNK